LIALQVNEATKVLDEGIAESAAEIDLAVGNGGGSPFGPFALAQIVGYDVLVEKLEELYKKFKLEVFKPTELMKKGDIKV
jgi:enoyl-CoA hydratase/3-hydroxyacyl-CoA dehydrogenase